MKQVVIGVSPRVFTQWYKLGGKQDAPKDSNLLYRGLRGLWNLVLFFLGKNKLGIRYVSYMERICEILDEYEDVILVPIPYVKNEKHRKAKLDWFLSRINGLIIPGGEDVEEDPKHRDKAIAGVVDETRNSIEFYLVREAKRLQIPTIGICRGIQLINLALGGTLTHHAPGHVRRRDSLAYRHAVKIVEGSVTYAIYGAAVSKMNSVHHQAIAKLAKGLRAVARALDGVIEAIQTADDDPWFCYAEQGHPELRNNGRYFRALLEIFIAKVRTRAEAK